MACGSIGGRRRTLQLWVAIQVTGAASTVYWRQRAGAANEPQASVGTATTDSSGAAAFADDAPLPAAANELEPGGVPPPGNRGR
jgi:hypothetical protein